MASSAQGESGRKHRRSASPLSGDDDADRTSSKRHKHRHHHRHHHRQGSSGSRKAEEEAKHEIVADDVVEGSPRSPAPPSSVDVARPLPAPPPRVGDDDDDLEEGEILDDEGDRNLVHDAEASLITMEKNAKGSISNGYSVFDASVKDKKEAYAPHHKISSRENSRYDADYVVGAESDVSDSRMSLPNSAADNYRTSENSPYSDRCEDDRLESRDHLREKSRSILQERRTLSKGRNYPERDSSYCSDRHRDDYDSDDRKVSSLNTSRRHGSRDIVKDTERERASSHSRYDSRDDRHHTRAGSRDRGTRREIDPRTEWEERERSRDRDIDKDYKKRNYQERSTDRDLERDIRREKQRDQSRDKEIDGDRRREKERDLNGESWRDRDRRKDRERDRSRERTIEKDRRREKEEDRSGENRIDRERRRSKERERSYDMAKESWRERDRERERERERDKYGDQSREKGRRSDRERLEDRKRDERKDVRNVNRHESCENNYGSGDFNKQDTIRSGVPGKSAAGFMESAKDYGRREEDEQDDSEENFLFLVPEQEEDHLNKIKEESRRLRQAILERHRNQQKFQQQKDVEPQVAGAVEDNGHQGRTIASSNLSSENPGEVADGVEEYVAEPSFSVGKSPSSIATEKASGEGGLGEGTPKSEGLDIFCDDIFGDSPAGTRKTGKGGGVLVERSGLHDNWDDPEGYYSYRLGEVLDGRYEVIAAHGKGVFSTVVRARDLKAGAGEPEEVAIKILRNKEAMYKAGVEELGILKKLVGADPEDKRHCVRLLSSFKYRNHLCLVFESLNMNLREVLKKFGRNIGLKLTAIRAYAKQLFIALKHLRNCGVLHCDIKPDNMLVNEAKNVLKLCDFGNAMYAGKNEITPYLVSRFYRAPEIILGLPYDHPMDIWSVGCCLYELYTGKVLFPGPTNNDMLRLHMELKGPFPKKMLRKGAFSDQHFDQDLNFLATEEDPVTKKTIKRMIFNVKPKDIGSIIKGSPGEDVKMLANFKDLLEKIFVLDPDKRMTVHQALNHPFITGK